MQLKWTFPVLSESPYLSVLKNIVLLYFLGLLLNILMGHSFISLTLVSLFWAGSVPVYNKQKIKCVQPYSDCCSMSFVRIPGKYSSSYYQIFLDQKHNLSPKTRVCVLETKRILIFSSCIWKTTKYLCSIYLYLLGYTKLRIFLGQVTLFL